MKKRICALTSMIFFSGILVGCENESVSNNTEKPSQAQLTTSRVSAEQALPAVESKKTSVQFDQNYEVKHTLSVIKLEGFLEDEPTPGIWSNSLTPSMTLYISKQQLTEHPTGTVHLRILPFIDPTNGLKAQHVNIHWGKGHALSDVLDTGKTVLLAYTTEDWTAVSDNSDLLEIVFQFDLPDATSPGKLLKTYTDERLLGLRFMQFSVS